RALVEDVGVEPGAALKKLEADILEQSPTLDVTPVAPTPTAAPISEPRQPEPAEPARVTDAVFVGRTRELATMLDAAREAGAGNGRPIIVSGEPGIGKTRLVEELVAQLPDAIVAWGRCPESATHAAYWSAIQIGRQLEGANALDRDLATSLLAN